MTGIAFTVPGFPKPAGSKRGFFNAKLKRVILTDACKESRGWKEMVAQFAQQAVLQQGLTEPLRGPLAVEFHFTMPRPKHHFGSGRNADTLKESAPRYHTSAPDVLKLSRAVEDAMHGIIYMNDSQIAVEVLKKTYGPRPGVAIVVKTMTASAGAIDVEEPKAADLFAAA